MNEPSSVDSNLHIAVEIDRICLKFEAAIKQGEQPEIESYISSADASLRESLLRELLLLEFEYLKLRGEAPTSKSYHDRFPDYQEAVSSALAEIVEETADTADLGNVATRVASLPKTPEVPDFEILEEVARGGMGVVYRARQISLDRIVALKMIRAGQFATEADVERFQREARHAADLQHPNIVPVYSVGECESGHFYTMEFIAGESLASIVRESALAANDAAKYLLTITEAVDYAHSKNTLHRDLKPANVLVDESGRVRVTDFGLARRIRESDGITETGQTLGTPGYMPPEQALGRHDKLGPTCDVYSLGATLYHLLTGRPPFVAANQVDTILEVLEQEPVSPRLLNAKIPRDLETICLKCLQKDPRQRYESARALADELKLFLAGKPITARPVGRVTHAWRWCRRNPAVAVLGSLAFMLLLTLAIGGPSIAAVAIAARDELGRQYAITKEALTNRDRAVAELDETIQDLDDTIEDLDAANLKLNDSLEEVRQERNANKELAIKEQTAKEAAIASQKETKRTLYRTDMRQVQRYYELSNIREVRRLLARHLPSKAEDTEGESENAEEDLRSFEWYYWWTKSHPFEKSWEHRGRVAAIDITKDGRWLAVGGGDRNSTENVIELWDLPAEKVVATFPVPNDEVVRILLSPNGKTLTAVTSNSWVRRWQVDDPETVAVYHLLSTDPKFYEPVHSVAFMADGSHLATATHEGQIVLSDLRKSPTPFDKNDEKQMRMLARLPKGEKKRLGMEGAEIEQPEELPIQALDLTLAALDGRIGGQRIRSGDHEKSVTIQAESDLRAQTRPVMSRLGKSDENAPPPSQYGGALFSIDIAPNAEWLVSGSRHGQVTLWSLIRGDATRTSRTHDGIVWDVEVSHDNRLFATAGDDGLVTIWDAEKLTPLQRLATGDAAAKSIAFSPDNVQIAVGLSNSDIQLWDVASGTRDYTLKGHEGAVNCLTFHPSRHQLISGSTDGTIKFWPTSYLPSELEVPSRLRVNTLYKASEIVVAATDEAGRLHAWNATTGAPIESYGNEVAGKPCLAISPLHSAIATAAQSDKGTAVIQVWSLQDGALLASMEESRAIKSPLPVFSPRGNLLVTIDSPWQPQTKNSNYTVWNVLTSSPRAKIEADSSVLPLCMAPNESVLIAVNEKKQLESWSLDETESSDDDTKLAKLLNTFSLTDEVFASDYGEEDVKVSCPWAKISPDSQQLVAGIVKTAKDSETTAYLRVWNLISGELTDQIELGDVDMEIWCGGFLADGERIYFQTIATDWEKSRSIQAELASLQVEAERAIATRNATLYQSIREKGRELVAKLAEHRQCEIQVCHLATADRFTVARGQSSWGSVIPLGGDRLAANVYGSGWIQILDVKTGMTIHNTPIAIQKLDQVVFLPNGQRIAVALQDQEPRDAGLAKFNNHAMIWRPETHTVDAMPLGQHWMGSKTTVCVTPDGENLIGFLPDTFGGFWTPRGYMVASPYPTGKVILLPVDANDDRQIIYRPARSHSYPITGSAVISQEEGWLVATSSADGSVFLYNVSRTDSEKTIQYEVTDAGKLKSDATFYLDVAFSPDRKTLAAAADHEIQLWDVATQTLKHTIKGHEDYVRGLAFSPDGSKLVSGSSDGTIRIWSLAEDPLKETSEEAEAVAAESNKADQPLKSPLIIVGHNGGVSGVAISPDGRTIASCGRDTTVRLWDVATGEEKAVFREHTKPTTSVQFSPDGSQLASCGEDGKVFLRVANIGDLHEE